MSIRNHQKGSYMGNYLTLDRSDVYYRGKKLIGGSCRGKKPIVALCCMGKFGSFPFWSTKNREDHGVE